MGQDLCQEHNMPADLSTGILIEYQASNNNKAPTSVAYRDSTAILQMLSNLTFPWTVIGVVALYLVPKFFRDGCYRAFARNRGAIWKKVKQVTRMGDTRMDPYRDKILGLKEFTELPPSWGFHDEKEDGAKKE